MQITLKITSTEANVNPELQQELLQMAIDMIPTTSLTKFKFPYESDFSEGIQTAVVEIITL